MKTDFFDVAQKKYFFLVIKYITHGERVDIKMDQNHEHIEKPKIDWYGFKFWRYLSRDF